MKSKSLLIMTILAFSPTVVAAACSGHSEQAMSCGEGSEYDPATGTCKVITG